MMQNNTKTVHQMYSPISHGGKIHIESEVILPDYCPDIARIVKSDITPKITSRNHYTDEAGLNITIDGTALFKILYLSEGDGKLCSTFFSQPFTHSFKLRTEEGTDTDDIFDCVSLLTENSSCRPTASRKAVIKGDISVISQVKLNRASEYFGGENEGCEAMCESLSVCAMTGCSDADFTISEKISLPAELPPAEEILDCSMRYVNDSIKTAEGKVIFSATAFFTCFYKSENGCVSFCQPIGLSQIMDIPGTESTHHADVYIHPTSLRADIDVDNYGENRIIDIDFSYTARAAVYGNRLFCAVTDVFCPQYEFTADYEDVTFRAFDREIYGQVPVKGSLKLKNPETVSLENICPSVYLRGWVIENGMLSLDGRLNLKMTAALSSGYDGIEENLDFSARIPLENPDICQCELNISVRDTDCVLSANSIEVSADVTVSGSAFTQSSTRCVKELSRGEKKTLPDRPPIILYYPSKEESLWDIAKKYSLPQKLIREFNGIEGNKITDTVIKIPQNI